MLTTLLKFIWLMPALFLLSAGTSRAADDDSLLDGKWTASGQTEGAAFSFAGLGSERRLIFDSGAGFATIEKPIALEAQPFTFSWEATVSKGRLASWRNSGVAIAISTCGIDAMTENDFALVMAVLQQGVRCTVVKSGCYTQYEKRPGVWGFRDRELPARFELSMAGGGGHDFSVVWPGKDAVGTTLRFTVWRDSANTIHYAVFHAASPDRPWWEGRYTLPEPFAGKPLTTLAIRTTNEAACLKRPPPQAAFKGEITRLEFRRLKADESFTPASLRVEPPSHWVLKKPAAAKHPSVFFTPDTLPELREKFNDPALANYRQLILRAAAPEVTEKVFQDSPPAWSSALTALTWAYVLTGDEAYWPRLSRAIDRLTTTADHLKQKQFNWPGHARQFLNLDEFNGHNLEALATAYDCIYDKLDEGRRTRVLRVLNRGLDYYLGRIKAKDWWYCNNPSNTIGVGNGLNAVVALVLRDYRGDDAKTAIDAAIETIKRRYVGVADDGGCLEGNMYWNYGMSYPIWFGYALKQTTGDDRGLLTSARLRNAGNYVKLMLGGDGKFLCFNDTQPWLNGMLICAHGGSANDLPFLRKLADQMAEQFAAGHAFPEQVRGQFSVSAFLGRDRIPAPKQWPPWPTLHVVESIQEGILRSDSRFEPALVTGVKGKGKLSTHHANEDQGSVVVYARGENFLLDPGYFEGDATEHTVPLVGRYTPRKSWDPRAAAPLSDRWDASGRRGMTVDATGACISIRANKNEPAKGWVRRVIVQVDDRAVVWLDDISVPPSENNVTAQYQCGFPVTLDEGGVRCRILGAKSDLALLVDGPPTTLDSNGRCEFSKDWVYARAGVQWYPVRAKYAANAFKPLISVCSPLGKDAPAPKVEVTRGERSIQVSIGEEKPLIFELVDNRWQSKKQ